MSQIQQSAGRDPRLDFFRGVAMLIIFIAHVPNNRFANWIPARFGFSDAAEMFVFLSGMAAAIAFAGTYGRAGFVVGSARIGFRCFQLYAAHLGMFFLIAAICVFANASLAGGVDYINGLNLWRFFNSTPDALLDLMTLTYVPNYFDIIPMYMGVLALVPVVMALSRIHHLAPPAFCLALYAAMWILDLEFLADSTNDRPWFFNPFGWQLLFFTGFCLGTGWVKVPAYRTWLMVLCVAYVLLAVPLAHWPIWREFEWMKELRFALKPFWIDKTNFGLMRWLHFLALAYITVNLLDGRVHWLQMRWAAPIVKTGQNALPVFFLSMTLSYVAGIVLDQIGRSGSTFTLVNLGGMGILILAAYMFGWFKATPWKRKPPPVAKETTSVRAETVQASTDTSRDTPPDPATLGARPA
ncbi:MAG: OpgC domain-containing protein [Pseudomonadota bacterium]